MHSAGSEVFGFLEFFAPFPQLELAAMAHYVVDRVTEDNVFSAC